MNKEDNRKIILSSWYSQIGDYLEKPYMRKLNRFLSKEYKNQIIYPRKKDIFKAFSYCNYDNLKLIVLGLDPYNNGYANGVAFATNKPDAPKSLRKIFEAMDRDLGIGEYLNEDYTLKYLCDQGILFLNTSLTVRKGQAKSHKNKGWELFIKDVIYKINIQKKNICFLTLGVDARDTIEYIIDQNKHFLYKVEHPAAACYNNREWNNKDCFNKINEYLKLNNKQTIIW